MSSADSRLGSPHRIVFLMSSLTIGGSEKKVSKVANHLVQSGWTVEVAYLNSPCDLADSFSSSIKQTCFHRRQKLDVATIFRLRHFLLARRPAIIIVVNLFPLLYLYLSGCLARQQAFRTVALINKTNYRKAIVDRFRALFYQRVLKRLDHIVFGAGYQRDLWEATYALRDVNSTVIYNGVDTDYFSPKALIESRANIRASLGIDCSDLVLVTVARFRPVKNLSLLLDAVNALRVEYPQIKVILVGDGPERTRLEYAADQLGVKPLLRFTGSQQDVRPMLLAGDLFVLTSESETFPNAALEAMSMGKAVILPKIGGCPEMVSEGINGWFFSAGSATSLCQCVRNATNDPTKIRTMGRAARQSVLERFPMREMLRKFEKLIYEVT